MSFENYGRVIDDMIQEARSKFNELANTVSVGMKTADRQGFERALRLAVLKVNEIYPVEDQMGRLKLVTGIHDIKYTREG